MPRHCLPAKLSKSEHAILKTLRNARSGVNSATVCQRVGLGYARTIELLRRLRRRGLAVVVGASTTAVWTLASREAALRQARSAQKRFNREAAIIEAIQAGPADGMQSAEVSKAIGLKVDRTREVLRILRDKGVLATTSRGAGAKWATAARAQAIREERDRLKLLERRAKHQKEDAEARQDRENAEFLVIRRRYVDVRDCLPLRPPGPASIFAMAAASTST
jgi:predicted transcriptional regulator